jgi:hypothetical protein
MPDATAGDDHAYVVLPGMMPVGVYANGTVVHVAVLCALIVATGLTVTVTVKAAPVQLPDGEVGVRL